LRAGIAAGAYLIALFLFTLRAPIPLWARIGTMVSALCVASAMGMAWKDSHALVRLGIDRNTQFETRFNRQMFEQVIRDSLIVVLRDYHAQTVSHRTGLWPLVARTFPFHDQSAVLRLPFYVHADSSVVLFVELRSDTMVVMRAYNRFLAGRDSAYANPNGLHGRIESSYILSPGGIRYDVRN
jgi:hypothetical protein